MILFVDRDFCLHTGNDGTMTAVETDFFDGKCAEFIEGYRFVPQGESWMREDGVVFAGEMISPWKDYAELDAAQRAYERQQMEDMREALNVLGVNVDG